jgi:hypothetical protein
MARPSEEASRWAPCRAKLKQCTCGATNKAVWQFHIVVAAPVNNPGTPIDGYLVLDAKNGKLVCANLPMLD